MAFELVGITTSESILETDTLLWDVARILLLSLPVLDELDRKFYDSPTFSASEAATLATELTLLAQCLREEPQVAQQAWAARPPAFRSQIMSHPPDVEIMVAKIEALALVCRDVAAHGGILRGLSD